MALPVNWETGHVEALYLDMEGDFDTGFVDFLPNTTRLTNASAEAVILPTKLTYTLVDGAIEVDVPATDDADTSPLGFTYTVVERLGSGLGKTYSIAIPKGVTTYLYNAVTLDPTDSLAGPVADLDFVPDGVARLAMLPSERVKLGSGFQAAVEAVIPVAPTSEVAYAQITSDLAALTIDTLLLDAVTGLAVTIPSIARPVYVFCQCTVHHTVANANIQPLLARTSPAPATILDALAIGFLQLVTAGGTGKGQAFVMCRIPASTPCTVQFYLSGTAGNATVTAQSYYPSKIWAVSM